MISREEAIDTLMEFVGTGLLDSDVENNIQGIISCLEAELIGRHEWGVPNEKLSPLYIAKRSDLITDEDIAACDRLQKMIVFTPSEFEKDVIRDNVIEMFEDVTGEEVCEEQIDKWFGR